MDERTGHEALLDELAQVALKFQDLAEKTNSQIFYEAVKDLQKVFAYLYVFGGQPHDSSSAETSD